MRRAGSQLSKPKTSKGEGGRRHKLNLSLESVLVLTRCSWQKTSSLFSAATRRGLTSSVKKESTWDPGYLVGSKLTSLLQSSIGNCSPEERSHRSCERGFREQGRLLLLLEARSWLSSFWRLVPNTAALHLLQPERGFLQKVCAPGLLKASYCQMLPRDGLQSLMWNYEIVPLSLCP